jgi:hypothetical protein
MAVLIIAVPAGRRGPVLRDRSRQFEDPFGHRWNVATVSRDVPPEQIAVRMAAVMGGAAG